MLRFPSTNVKIWFTSLLDDNVPRRVPSPPKATKNYSSLKIKIPDARSTPNSPVPSPTGTIRLVCIIFLYLRVKNRNNLPSNILSFTVTVLGVSICLLFCANEVTYFEKTH